MNLEVILFLFKVIELMSQSLMIKCGGELCGLDTAYDIHIFHFELGWVTA